MNKISFCNIDKREIQNISKLNSKGFSIVELLVVIVVIGILAAIVIVSYSGIDRMAREVSLQSDINNVNKQLALYYIDYGKYPTTNNCELPQSDTNICLKYGSNTSLEYLTSFDQKSYTVAAKDSVSNFRQSGGLTSSSILSCPSGYILVPGSPTYGTDDFCVMKYEAKNVNNIPVSQPGEIPWRSISGNSAIIVSTSACEGCHLITNAEWLTIAQNILSVPSNWSGNVVGSGYVYNGVNDSITAAPVAVTNANDSYSDTGFSAPSIHRRTLSLTNGEVIWDLAGNVREFTSDTINCDVQPGLSGQADYAWNEWNNSSIIWDGLPESSKPSFTGLTNSANWSSNEGIGQLYSNPSYTGIARAYIRGGDRGNTFRTAGVFALTLENTLNYSGTSLGFRVVK